MKWLTGLHRWNPCRAASARLAGVIVPLLVTACSGHVGVSDTVGLTFATPADGAIVSRTDDVDPVAAGIQMDVTVQVTALDGTVVMLEDVSDPSTQVAAVVAGGTAVFPSFTIASTGATLQARTAICDAYSCIAQAYVTVLAAPPGTQVLISGPANGDAVPAGDVSITIDRLGGSTPRACGMAVDGNNIGVFQWEDPTAPLVVGTTMLPGSHTLQALCYDGDDVLASQLITIVVGGEALAKTVTIAAPTDAILNAASDTDDILPGLQIPFTVTATDFLDGAKVLLCSTLPAAPGPTVACPGGGVVVATAVLLGDLAETTATFDVSLGEGQQTIHAEAFQQAGDPHVSSAAYDVLVDTIPPVFVSIVFPDNGVTNDLPDVLHFGLPELQTDSAGPFIFVVVNVAGLESLRPVQQIIDGTVRGAEVDSLTAKPFDLHLPDGLHTIAFAMTDAAGNHTASATISVEVDTTAGAVVVDPPTATPYTVSSTDIGVTIGDASGGGTILLERFSAASGGSALASSTSSVIAAGTTHVVFPSFPLAQGLSYLQATYTDSFGNVVVSARVLYTADAIGPTIALGVRTAAGAVLSCGTLGTSCLADTLPYDPATLRIRLDRAASNATCGGFGPCSSAGTDLFVTLSQCINSDPSLESCPVTVRLQSRLPGDPAWADVVGGVFTTGDVSTASIVSGPEFAPGVVRELRLVTEDSNHNPAVSASVFLTLNFAGVLIEVERLDASFAPTGDALASGRYFGIAEDVLGSSTGRFATNFRAHLTPIGVSPTTIELAIDNTSGTSAVAGPVLGGGTYADLAGAELLVATDPAAPSTNALSFTAMCGASPCSQTVVYSGIVADIAAPTYQFDRCSLCALHVPLVSTACPAACVGGDSDPGANIAGAGAAAVWNLALDADHDGSNGFNATLTVKIGGLENGRDVRLDTDLGTLGGNVATASGCPNAATCVATFSALTASQLAGTAVRRISVSFTDRAGNPAVPAAVRIDSSHESIYALTDVIPPANISPVACIGESTVPVSGSATGMTEDPSCAATCASTGKCDRAAGKASLRWTAPGDDGNASGYGAVSYVVGAIALGIPYPALGGATLTSCADVTPDTVFEVNAVMGAPQTGGTLEQAVFPNLYPHRDYCFMVVATDDAGNRGSAGAYVTRRKLPLVTTPSIQSFDGVVRDDAQAVGAFRSEPSSPPDFGAVATALPDLDGDGRDDVAVAQWTSGSVHVFLSGSPTPFAPAFIINAPAIAYSGAFGSAIAGGDFDGDGANDLVICDANLLTTGFAQAGSSGGAVFIYYGDGTGISRTANTFNPQVPSLLPDVSLLGRAGQHLCAGAVLGDVSGDGKPDLTVMTHRLAFQQRVFAIFGGSRGRLPTGASYFDLDDAPWASGPDFAIVPSPSATAFPQQLAIGDYDADGVDEIAVSDNDAVYVYDGATLTSTVTYSTPGIGFGAALATVPSPRGTTGDWLLVGTTGDLVVVLKTGFMSAVYPLAPGAYELLDGTDFGGSPATRFGRSLAALGNFDGAGGIDIAAGPGVTASGGPYEIIIFSFDASSDSFAKRAILEGAPGFGSVLAGVRGFSGAMPIDRAQLLVVQRFAARLYLFR